MKTEEKKEQKPKQTGGEKPVNLNKLILGYF